MQNSSFILFILLKKSGLKRNHKILDLNLESNDILKSYVGSKNYNPTELQPNSTVDFVLGFDLKIDWQDTREIAWRPGPDRLDWEQKLELFLNNIKKICDKKTKIIISILPDQNYILNKNDNYYFNWFSVSNDDDLQALFVKRISVCRILELSRTCGFKAAHIKNPEKDLFPFLDETISIKDKIIFILNKLDETEERVVTIEKYFI